MAHISDDHSVSTKSLDLGHEPDNVQLGAIVKFAVGLVVSTTVIFFLVAGLLKAMTYQLDQDDKQNMTPMTMQYGEQVPPQGTPRLQLAPYSHIHPLDEYKGQKEQWTQTLEKGGMDKENVQRIPIEKAEAMLLQQGVPTRKQEAATSNETNKEAKEETSGKSEVFDDVPSYQSSGRATERRYQ